MDGSPRLISLERRTGAQLRVARLRSRLWRRRSVSVGGGMALNTSLVEAAARELGIRTRSLPGGFLELERAGIRAYARGADFGFERLLPWQLCGDKRATAAILVEHGLPVARSRSFSNRRIADALHYFDGLGGPAVTKPAFDTSSGAGVSTNLSTRDQLAHGFVRAAELCSEVLVEAHHDGANIRVTVLAGEVIGAVRRQPAFVVGDGRTDIRGLVKEKNDRLRTRHPENRLLRPITIDHAVGRKLRAQGLNLGSVPPAGMRIPMRDQCNADLGGEVEDAMAGVHQEYLTLAQEATRAMGAELAGVDLICASPESPRTTGNVVINEVNTTPALYIVDPPVAGVPSTRAARLALERLFDVAGMPSDRHPSPWGATRPAPGGAGSGGGRPER